MTLGEWFALGSMVAGSAVVAVAVLEMFNRGRAKVRQLELSEMRGSLEQIIERSRAEAAREHARFDAQIKELQRNFEEMRVQVQGMAVDMRSHYALQRDVDRVEDSLQTSLGRLTDSVDRIYQIFIGRGAANG